MLCCTKISLEILSPRVLNQRKRIAQPNTLFPAIVSFYIKRHCFLFHLYSLSFFIYLSHLSLIYFPFLMVRVLSLICAAVTLFSASAVAKSNVVEQYTVSCQKTYVVKNGDTVSIMMLIQCIQFL